MPTPSREITVYHLEMLDPTALRRKAGPPGFEVALVDPPDPETNRAFYQQVGAPWRWTDRLDWSADQWQRYVHRDALKTWLGRLHGAPVGYFELETQDAGNVEIAYFGLLSEFVGRGLGGALLSAALELAWDAPDTRRVWVHTCTDDHPHALENYRKRGFRLFRTEHRQKRVQ
jgi:GNAT superfamily N-acetyltransferase